MPKTFSNVTSCSLQDGQQYFVGIFASIFRAYPSTLKMKTSTKCMVSPPRNILSLPRLNLQFYSADR